MNQIVAEDGNVIVYNSTKVNIFTIMTEFVLESSTDSKSIDLTSIRIKRPKASFTLPFLWDEERDRPTLTEIDDSGISFGFGSSLTFGVSTRCSFDSMWDVSITFQFVFEGKFGAELLMPNDCTIEIDGKELKSLKTPINGLGFSSKFLGLQISLGAFMNFVIEFTDIKVNVPIGFDYFKGYFVTATKFFQITPTSISDSKWEITTSSLPSGDSISNIVKNLQEASFTVTLQFRPYLSLEFILADIETSLEAGIKIPFVFTLSLNRDRCNFPFLYGVVEIPIKMYFAFGGIKAFDYDIINDAEKEIELFSINISPFCIGRSKTYDNPNSEHFYSYVVHNDEIYEERINSEIQYEKQISLSLITENGVISDEKLKYPLTKYGDSNNKKNFEMLYYQKQPPSSSQFKWYLHYYDKEGEFQKSSSDFLAKISELKFEDKNEVIISPVINIGDSDKTYMKSYIKKAQQVIIGIPFSPEGKVFCLSIDLKEGDKLALYYIDENDQFVKDEETIFYLANDLNRDFETKGEYRSHSDQRMISLRSFISESDKEFRIIIDFYLKPRMNNEGKTIKISSFCTKKVLKGKWTNPNVGYRIYHWEAVFSIYDTQSLYYSGKIIYEDQTEKEIQETLVDYKKLEDERKHDFLIQLNEYINLSFFISKIAHNVIVESTRTEKLPSVMIILQIKEVDENHNISNLEEFYFSYQPDFHPDARYQMHRIHIPDLYRNSKLFIIYSTIKERSEVTFHGDKIVPFSSDQVYFDIDGRDIIELVISRVPYKNRFIYLRFIYCEFTNETLFLSQQGKIVNLGYEIPSLILIPLFFNRASYLISCVENCVLHKKYTTIQFNLFGDSAEEYAVYTFFDFIEDPGKISVKLITSVIGELEPYLIVDLSFYENDFDFHGEIPYVLMSETATQIKCEFNGEIQIVKRNKEKEFEFSFKKSDKKDFSFIASFTSVCYDNTSGVACEILYPAPERSGFHLIEYPDRDGISTTGRGFLRELISVEAGKSFVYYKTYNGSIKLIREYYTDQRESKSFSIKIKIEDNRNSKIEGFLRSRRICLFDEQDNILPFSRKYYDNNTDLFLTELGIVKDVDYNHIINDQDGCIVVDPKYIESNDFNKIPKNVCDLFVDDINDNNFITDVDKSNIIFEAGGKDPQQKKKMIIIIVVVIIVVVVVIVTLVVILKRRRKRKNDESTEEANEKDESKENNNDI